MRSSFAVEGARLSASGRHSSKFIELEGMRLTQTMGVGRKTSNNRKQSMGLGGTNDVVCQRHFHRFGSSTEPFGENSYSFFMRLFVMSIDKSLIDFNEIKRIVRPT